MPQLSRRPTTARPRLDPAERRRPDAGPVEVPEPDVARRLSQVQVVLVDRGAGQVLGTSAPHVGSWILRQGQDFVSASLRRDRRVRGMVEVPAVSLDSAWRLQKAEALSVTGDPRGLSNSCYLNQALRRETKRTSRNGRPLSVLFLDLDGFTAINDSHGICVVAAHWSTLPDVAESAEELWRARRSGHVRGEGRRQARRARRALPETRVPLYGAGAGRPTVEVEAERRPRSAR